ncbi:MAG: twin transmembrane helix small protein [Rhodospirillales bacterium]|nr:twin transmembrane helix small protein [Acetobacter sp.]
MHTALTILVAILMFATLGVLVAGLVQMVREPDGRRSNKLMQWRVAFQASAILLFIIMMTLLRS